MKVPEKIVRLVQMTMSQVLCQVKVGGLLSDPFETARGLRQGDALACLLFNIALEKAIRDSKITTSGNLFNRMVQILGYADDIDIAARSVAEMRKSFLELERAAKNVGLEINASKTKVMMASTSEARIRGIGSRISTGNHNFEVVQEFKYLGSLVNKNNDFSTEIKKRILLANGCYFGMIKYLKSKILSRATKIKLYKSLIVPVLIYGSETWTMTKRDEGLLRRFERKILRRIFGAIKEGDAYRQRYNAELYELYRSKDIVTAIKLGRRWAGHVIRANGSPIKQILQAKPEGNRRPGRPRLRWLDMVDRDARAAGLRGWKRLAQNRDDWRHKLGEARTLEGLSRQ